MTVEWWKDKVAEDIYDTMRKKEQDNFTTYNCHSTQLWARRQLVDWISVIVENFNLDMTSHHLAVYLLDFFMEKLEVDTNHLYLLAIACICLAGKITSDKYDQISLLLHMLFLTKHISDLNNWIFPQIF